MFESAAVSEIVGPAPLAQAVETQAFRYRHPGSVLTDYLTVGIVTLMRLKEEDFSRSGLQSGDLVAFSNSSRLDNIVTKHPGSSNAQTP